MDRDGTRNGFDCEMTGAVSGAVPIPVIASGGAGTFGHFADVFTAGRADAALAASIFHYAEHSVADSSNTSVSAGFPCGCKDRLDTPVSRTHIETLTMPATCTTPELNPALEENAHPIHRPEKRQGRPARTG